MSQAPTSPSPAKPSQPIVDYNARPAPRRGSWLNLRIVMFVIVFGAIIGIPFYIYIEAALTHGISTGANGVKIVDLKAMSTFALDQQAGKTEDVPQRYRELDGQKVSLVGEMYAPSAASPVVGQFDLVYSIAKCCFSGPAQVQHFVKSTPRQAGTGMPFYSGLVRVTGTLHVGVIREEDKITSVYRVDVDSIDPI